MQELSTHNENKHERITRTSSNIITTVFTRVLAVDCREVGCSYCAMSM